MKENEKITKRPYFKKLDVLLYFLLVVLIAGLMIGLLNSKKPATEGFKVTYANETALIFNFSQNDYSIGVGFDIHVSNEGDEWVFTVSLQEGFNKIKVNVKNKTVSVIDADCSFSKDCVYSAPISNGKGVIICAPHNLMVLPISETEIPPMAG